MMAGDAYKDSITKLVKNRKDTLLICHHQSLPLVVFVVDYDLKSFGGNNNNNF